MRSRSEARLLRQMSHSLLTIDIWDTILRRRCHPDEVKLYTARGLLLSWWREVRPELRHPVSLLHLRQRCEHEIGREAQALGMDDEYRLMDVLERWAGYAMSAPEAGRAGEIARWAYELEMAQEREVTYADEQVQGLLEVSNGSKRVALSDFYVGSSELHSLLELKAPRVRVDEVVVSCEVGLNKRSGRLYTYMHDRARVTPGQHAHIGDNPEVDVLTPHRLGVRTVRYAPAAQEARRAEHRKRWELRQGGVGGLVGALRRDIAGSVRAPGRLTAAQREMFYFGARCAPLYVGLVLRAIEQAIYLGVPRVHYFTREGVFFQRVHDVIAGTAPGRSLLGVDLPTSELLEVSRLSTFCASIREVSVREFMRVWNLYSTQSISGLLATLDIPELSVRPLLGIHGLDAGEAICHPWLDPRVRALLADRRFAGTLERVRTSRRAVLREYLAGRGFEDDGSAKVVVDIGWRGTIQDNLAHLYPGCRITGVYLGMHRVLNEQPGNVEKIAYACDVATDEAACGPLLEHVQPLEAISNSPDGSVRGYRRGERAGKIAVERAGDPGETGMWEDASRYFQKGVLAAAPVVTRWIRDYAFSSEDLRPMALEAVRDIFSAPPVGICEAFFRLSHNETFGLGGFVQMGTADPSALARRARTDEGAARALAAAAWESKWPCAFFRAHGLEQERLAWARARYGYRPDVDIDAGGAPEARSALVQIESSRSYRMVRACKSLWPVRLINRLRFGEHHDLPPSSDPVARLAAIRRSRAFRVLRWVRHLGPVRARAIRKYGMDALGRW